MEFVQPLRQKRDIARVRAKLKEKNLRDYALFVLGVNAGLRISDLLRLSVGDVLSGSGSRIRIAQRLSLREGKTGKAKSFPLNEKARSALALYLKSRGAEKDEPLFPSRQKRDDLLVPVSRCQAWRALSKAAKAVGVADRIGTHTLRKTFGYHCYLAGVDITRVQKMLNHSSPEVTLRYIGITQDELDNYYREVAL